MINSLTTSHIVLFIGIILSRPSAAHQSDSLSSRKNIIKYHFVSSMLYKSSFLLSYERTLKKNRSFAVMGGYLQFPVGLKLGSRLRLVDSNKKSGFAFGGEYRFYLEKENKYPAPHGIYIGPYINTYRFNNERTLSFTDSNGITSMASLQSDIGVLNVGVQLGYQFVFKDRWTLDLIFLGPSVSQYALKLGLDGSLNISEGEIKDEILQGLLDRFPLLDNFVEDKEINLQGRSSSWAPGFRYQFNVGYRFGKNNNK